MEQFLDNILESINFSKEMSVAMIAALENNPHPNPKVGAALYDIEGKLISFGIKKSVVSLFKYPYISVYISIYIWMYLNSFLIRV